jgi:hypothetical protein
MPDEFIGHAAGMTREHLPEIERKFLDHKALPYAAIAKTPRRVDP